MKIGSHQTPFQGHPRGVTFINFFISCLTSTYTTFPTVTNEAVLISQYPSVEKDTGDHGVVLMTRVRRGVSSLSGSCDTVDTTVTHYLTITHYLSYILGTDDSLCVCVCVCVCTMYWLQGVRRLVIVTTCMSVEHVNVRELIVFVYLLSCGFTTVCLYVCHGFISSNIYPRTNKQMGLFVCLSFISWDSRWYGSSTLECQIRGLERRKNSSTTWNQDPGRMNVFLYVCKYMDI